MTKKNVYSCSHKRVKSNPLRRHVQRTDCDASFRNKRE